jgi:hypothetical protein
MIRASVRLSIFFLAAAIPCLGGAAELETPACASQPESALLDFWIGSGDVFVGSQKVGESRIRKILDGCAITEDWTDARGARGHSLFYQEPANRKWKQVWVTQRSLGRGGLKEKELIARLPGGALRFQGEVTSPDGSRYLDRTTLTPGGPGEVHQRIEISLDGGQEWKTTFDARYLRRREGALQDRRE